MQQVDLELDKLIQLIIDIYLSVIIFYLFLLLLFCNNYIVDILFCVIYYKLVIKDKEISI